MDGVDPELRQVLEQAAAARRPELSRLEALRESTRILGELLGAGPTVERVGDFQLGGVPVREYVPLGAGGDAVLVWLHGGGWSSSSVAVSDSQCRLLALAAGCMVVSVEYRLAPESPYPAALDDAEAVVRELAGRGRRVAVGGDSAGGNLAAALALRLRESGPRLVHQLLVYPVTDHDFTAYASAKAYGSGFGLDEAQLAWCWDQYAPDAAIREAPDLSPIRATSLAGLPPATVVTAELDPLRDQGEAYARRLAEAGVPVVHRRYDGATHTFMLLANRVPLARRALERAGVDVAAAFGRR
jgi:acetyl esterase